MTEEELSRMRNGLLMALCADKEEELRGQMSYAALGLPEQAIIELS